MHRSIGMALAGVFIVLSSETRRAPAAMETASLAAPVASTVSQTNTNVNPVAPSAVQDVAALLGAARGVPPLICAFAAQSVWGGGWGGWYDAPSSPVASEMTSRVRNLEREKFGEGEVRLLMDSLSL